MGTVLYLEDTHEKKTRYMTQNHTEMPPPLPNQARVDNNANEVWRNWWIFDEENGERQTELHLDVSKPCPVGWLAIQRNVPLCFIPNAIVFYW